MDRIKPIDQLTIAERLNVEADQIANNANILFRKKRKQYIQYDLPNGNAYLRIDGKAIWSDERSIVMWRRSEFALQDYYMRSFAISNDTLHSINWSGLKITRTTLTPSIRQFSVKLGINWLATGKLKKRYGDEITECILCGREEDTMHLLLCPNRMDLVIGLLKQFQQYLEEITTDPTILTAIIYELHRFFALTEVESFSSFKKPTEPSILKAINSQEAIGWHRFVRGYLSSAWAQLQDNYFIQKNSKQLGDSWSGKVGVWWTKRIHEIWTCRNESIHISQSGLQSRIEEETFHKVQELYNQSELLPAEDRNMLNMPLVQRLAQPIQSLRRWLTLTEPTIRRCIQDFQNKTAAQNRSIRDFLSTALPFGANHKELDNGYFPWRDTPDLIAGTITQNLERISTEVATRDIQAPTTSQDSLSS
jgi:hypothetical protein